jgi:hypothetical protein
MDGAERGPGHRHLRLGDGPGDAEVDDLHPPIAPDQDIAGLDVAVDDAPGVTRGERAADAGRDAGRLGRRQGAVPAQDRRQVLAVHVLHHDERPRRVLAVVVHGDDVRVAQRGGVLRLLAEA